MIDNLEFLLAEGIDRLTAGADVPADLVSRAGRAVRRRRRARLAAAAGATVTAAAVTAVAVLAASPASTVRRHPGEAAGRSPIVAAPMPTTAYVVSRISRAVASQAAASPVLSMRTVHLGHLYASDPPPGTVQVSWTQGYVYRTSTLGSGGRIVSASRSVVSGVQINTLDVDYVHDTWSTSPGQLSPGLAGQPCESQPSPVPDCPGSLASQIRQEIASGRFRLIGRQFVDGVNAIKLTGKQPAGLVQIKPHKQWQGYTRQTLWVNPNTYLPVRWTTVTSLAGLGWDGTQQDLRWLPATQANLNRLLLTVPPGFRHA